MGPGMSLPVLALVLCILERLLYAGAVLGARRGERPFLPLAHSPIIERRNGGKVTGGLGRVDAIGRANKTCDFYRKQRAAPKRNRAEAPWVGLTLPRYSGQRLGPEDNTLLVGSEFRV